MKRLQGVNVMDYSLILVVDTDRMELVGGIVDFLVPYDWRKRLESAAKLSVLKKPTVIPPAEYKKRFLEFILKKLLAVKEASSSVEAFTPTTFKSLIIESTIV
ncbi:unnamed protein product [Microthlaspi erraticum]|uniref:PIPK domain-containing protein n=1 Tax=Microthlaspi erraticum TaxID=1685480 RepID=A0A6D2JEB7_9BRAS|nr:unnamed protein product [Microthlaspi erraticum]